MPRILFSKGDWEFYMDVEVGDLVKLVSGPSHDLTIFQGYITKITQLTALRYELEFEEHPNGIASRMLRARGINEKPMTTIHNFNIHYINKLGVEKWCMIYY